MKRHLLLAIAATVVLGASLQTASAQHPIGRNAYVPNNRGGQMNHGERVAYRRAQTYPWHGFYYNTSYGYPMAVAVPPTADSQMNYGWGVGNTRAVSINHQFHRPFPGYQAGLPYPTFYGTPYWPSDTTQFGYYYVRGPW